MSRVHGLEGEIALAERLYQKAIESLLLADREFRDARTVESLANAYRVTGDRTQAIAHYETLLAMDALGWEPQQRWIAAHYTLADLYRQAGQLDRARQTADALLTIWTAADPDLLLLARTRELREQLGR